MKRLTTIIAIVGLACIVLPVFLAAFVFLFRMHSLAVLLVVSFFYGWMLFAYLHYRQGRQAEFLRLLITAAESNAPLAPALHAYLRDRPHGPVREFMIAVLLFFVIPGYYWFWHRRHSYDCKLARVARLLDLGVPLSVALHEVPGVAPRETQLAVAVGESTGELARCLRVSNPAGLAAVWLEVLPRFLYPPLLLFFISGITVFWATFLLPRMERIFHDFKTPLPPLTKYVGSFGRNLTDYGGLVVLPLAAVPIVAVILLYTPTPLWYVPVFGRVYRLSLQSRVLRMLAVLLQAGRPVPEALAILADSGGFPPKAMRLLNSARRAVENGEPLAESLRRSGFLQPAMVPLLQAAERVHNLPWAMAELGETLVVRLARLLRRVSLAVMPVCLFGVGALVGLTGLGMYLPLIQLLTRLTE